MEKIKTPNSKQASDKQPNLIFRFFAGLGPGLVTGAADDDPSGIVTYSQSGAVFGLAQLWTVIFILPLLVAVQELSARIGLVTGRGITRVLKENYSRKILIWAVSLLVIANVINLGADLGAMAAVVQLFVKLPFAVIATFFFLLTVGLEIFVSYHRYAKILKWLTFSLLAYLLTGIIVAHQWGAIFKATFLPHLQFSSNFLVLLLGIVGTTISPYMFFWQASQEVEEKEDISLQTHTLPKVTKRYLAGMRLDTFSGMLFSEIAAWFIIITTAVVLHSQGITHIDTAAQAAQALEPLVHGFKHSGKISEILFAAGIIGTGLLTIPIFAATSAYAVSEVFDWSEGLSKKFNQARPFYVLIIIGTLIGLLINLLGFNPISALVYTAVINGIVAAPIVLLLIFVGNNKKIMGKHTNGIWSNFFCWLTFAGLSIAAILTLYNFFF